MGSKTRTCSWEELSRHNNEQDCWVAVDGKVYDVTEWIPKHPGGKDLLLLCAGRDVTNLFESYHPLSTKPAATIGKYYVCDIANTELPKYTSKSQFYSTLRKRVKLHFEKTKQDPQNSVKTWARVVFNFIAVIALYCLSHFGYFTSLPVQLILAAAFGVSEALFAIHVMHDSCHAALSHNPSVWKYVGSTFDFLTGSSFFAWVHQHVIGHHLYTNIYGTDPDIGGGENDFRRIAPSQKWKKIYQYQHIYAPIMYGLMTIKYRFEDWQTFVYRINGAIRVLTPSTYDFSAFILGKIFWFSMMLVIPPIYFGVPFSRALFMFFISELASGYYLAFVFQISHIAGDLDFWASKEDQSVDYDWAIAQINTTQDYAHGNKLTTYLTGALNYQSVHHLFPTITQDYYPEIAPIVQQTCAEFGVRYRLLPGGFLSAFKTHIDYLKLMGEPTTPKKQA